MEALSNKDFSSSQNRSILASKCQNFRLISDLEEHFRESLLKKKFPKKTDFLKNSSSSKKCFFVYSIYSRRDVQQRVDRGSMQMVLTPYDLFS
jgi:hypothetical protein